MALTDGAQAMIAAGTALYGFVVAYYVFARILQDQERWHEEYRWHDWKSVSAGHRKKAFRKLAGRAILLNIFLLASSFLFLLMLTGNLLFLTFGTVGFLESGIVMFFLLVYLVAFWFTLVAALNLDERLREWRGGAESEEEEGE